MSDIDLVVRSSKHIEASLARLFGATGKGLHEKVSSVENKLSSSMAKQIRYIATIRNKIIHDENYNRIDDRKAFKSAVKRVKAALRKLEKPSGLKRKLLVVILFLLLLVLAAAYSLQWLAW